MGRSSGGGFRAVGWSNALGERTAMNLGAPELIIVLLVVLLLFGGTKLPLLASPEYQVTKGRFLFHGDDITDWPTDIRGKAGMFLAFQYPQTIAGVSVLNFLRQALSARKGIDLSVLELRLAIMEWMERLEMDPSFLDRYLNEGFSGGEKKRNEILQMAILEPELAVLDETDSGLDIDALKVVAKGVQEVRADRHHLGVLCITQYH